MQKVNDFIHKTFEKAFCLFLSHAQLPLLSGIILFAAGHPRNAFKWGENTKRIEILKISKVPKPAEAFLFVEKKKIVGSRRKWSIYSGGLETLLKSH